VRRQRTISRPQSERGIVILLVAVVLLFVVGAMAALAIDVVTFYTARSEAQLAADGAALAAARVMANSGSTSGLNSIEALAQPLAITAANQVASQNKVGGRYLTPATEVVVTFLSTAALKYNPRVNVKVTRTDLPTFFARIWGSTQVTVSASATAEAYNPSGVSIALGAGGPIAPACVKPWLLPNLNPTGAGAIFNPNGTIVDNTLVGQSWQLEDQCDSCGAPPNSSAGKYYPAAIDPAATDPQEFPVPAQSLPACTSAFPTNAYQLAVAGCVPKPITCGLNADYNIDVNTYTPTGTDRNDDTVQAAKCLIHDKGADGDSDVIDSLALPSPPFRFIAGNAHPIASAVSHDILVSDSLVTVPVFDSGPAGSPVSSPVQVIGFLQLFLNPLGNTMSPPQIRATIINMAGCGTTATGQPVLGTGASAIPVRLVSNP
jgi:putative Flp pilus-assembly TadE/G-like protein